MAAPFSRPAGGEFDALKRRKLQRCRELLLDDALASEGDTVLDCLPDELREKYDIVDTENVSANEYDPIALGLINQHADGMVLDCGSGKRGTYYGNVVNFEIVPYETTDVLGVGEELPFKEGSFDAVLSLNVLEHVQDPFKCAQEIIRVLKPGGSLYCVVPFLQPLHAYPHHYYNMSHQGLRNLFRKGLDVVRQDVIASGHPIWTLSWFLRSWTDGLVGKERSKFMNLRVSDLMGNPVDYLDLDFVKNLPEDKRYELASTTALIARKPDAA